MKVIFLLLSIVAFISCKKEGIYTMVEDFENPTTEDAIVFKQGEFRPTTGITVKGSSEIIDKNGIQFVHLKDFSIQSGPDLKVYLSKNESPLEFVNLGALDTDKYYYEIPSQVKLEEFSHVVIHCQQYNHTFAFALLK